MPLWALALVISRFLKLKLQDSSFPDTVTQSHVVKFLKDYFTVYDSDNRNVLDGAYHPSAVFSLSTSYNGAVKFK